MRVSSKKPIDVKNKLIGRSHLVKQSDQNLPGNANLVGLPANIQKDVFDPRYVSAQQIEYLQRALDNRIVSRVLSKASHLRIRKEPTPAPTVPSRVRISPFDGAPSIQRNGNQVAVRVWLVKVLYGGSDKDETAQDIDMGSIEEQVKIIWGKAKITINYIAREHIEIKLPEHIDLYKDKEKFHDDINKVLAPIIN